jgi:hypothetical protein
MSHDIRKARHAGAIARELETEDLVRPKRRKALAMILGGIDSRNDNSKQRCKSHRRK